MAFPGRRRAEEHAAELEAANRRAAEQDHRLQAAADEVGQLRAALDAVPVGVVVTRADGEEVVRNAAAMVGGHADVLLGDAIARLGVAARQGAEGAETVTLFGPPRRVLQVRAVPLPGGGSMVSIDDVSERARLDAVRTDFVTNISHELKTPVGALAILAETIADGDDPGVNRRLAERMVEEAHRASRTIDDLLELSRIELGGEGARERIAVAAVVEEAMSRHRFHAEQRGVSLVVGQVDRVEIDGDRLQLVSAVSNLVDNAVKYSNEGGVVTVSAVQDGGDLVVAVQDAGIGIPAIDLDRVFERFYRVDAARSRRTGGTGLGLAIVRHVAANHGGVVRVESVEGVGSRFELVVPAGDRQ